MWDIQAPPRAEEKGEEKRECERTVHTAQGQVGC